MLIVNRRNVIFLIGASCLSLPVALFTKKTFNQGQKKYLNSSDLPQSISHLKTIVGDERLLAMADINPNQGSFGIVEIDGYLLSKEDWEIFLSTQTEFQEKQ